MAKLYNNRTDSPINIKCNEFASCSKKGRLLEYLKAKLTLEIKQSLSL